MRQTKREKMIEKLWGMLVAGNYDGAFDKCLEWNRKHYGTKEEIYMEEFDDYYALEDNIFYLENHKYEI